MLPAPPVYGALHHRSRLPLFCICSRRSSNRQQTNAATMNDDATNKSSAARSGPRINAVRMHTTTAAAQGKTTRRSTPRGPPRGDRAGGAHRSPLCQAGHGRNGDSDLKRIAEKATQSGRGDANLLPISSLIGRIATVRVVIGRNARSIRVRRRPMVVGIQKAWSGSHHDSSWPNKQID